MPRPSEFFDQKTFELIKTLLRGKKSFAYNNIKIEYFDHWTESYFTLYKKTKKYGTIYFNFEIDGVYVCGTGEINKYDVRKLNHISRKHFGLTEDQLMMILHNLLYEIL